VRTREHFLLGTEYATISVTAKQQIERSALFQYAVKAVLTRYREEFGDSALEAVLAQLTDMEWQDEDWRIRPEDSCWENVKHMK
jgi:hypothetical protein